MTDEVAAPAAEAPISTPAVAPIEGPISVKEAADRLTAARKQAETPDTNDKPAQPRVNGKFAKPESALEGADATPETPSGEDVSAEPEELPPIEPPKSWTAEQKDRFSALPREAQEIIAERETARDTELRRNQNETAERTKALEAERAKVEQERVRAEQATTNAFQIIQSELARDFPDIKSHEDAAKLASEDPFRWAQWKQRVDNLQVLGSQIEQQQQQKAAEAQTHFKSWSAEQDQMFEKQFPEFADEEKGGKARSMVTNYLTKTVGVPADVLPALWNDDKFRDARWQRVIYDAARFASAQEKAKAVSAAPKPPVQRPGTAPQKGNQANIESLSAKLANAKGIDAARIGAELLRARRTG